MVNFNRVKIFSQINNLFNINNRLINLLTFKMKNKYYLVIKIHIKGN